MITKFLIEGLDRLGKDTLIDGIQQARGFHHVLHFSKPLELDCYRQLSELNVDSQMYRNVPGTYGCGKSNSKIIQGEMFRQYQLASFRNMFMLLRDPYTRLIMNRAHLGECVYAPLYRGYAGEYVFDIERQFEMAANKSTRLILLWEDFEIAKHFVDDGLSLGSIENRQREQELFIKAFNRSAIPDKRMICVTDQALGGFKPRDWILTEAIAD